ncbi:hypothetical protein [Bacteroides heparinolyticus]|uniref:hypothetical protein n=1 Tax=Prevotella heparinolytica TaxID=28113 RepID=UPI0035A0903C
MKTIILRFLLLLLTISLFGDLYSQYTCVVEDDGVDVYTMRCGEYVRTGKLVTTK